MRSAIRGVEAVAAVVFVAFVAIPFTFFVTRAGVTASVITDDNARVVIDTIRLASTTAAFATTLGFVFSWLLKRYRWPARLGTIATTALRTPYLLPPFFFAMGWIAAAAPEAGYLQLLAQRIGLTLPPLYGMGGMIFVLTLWSAALAAVQFKPLFDSYPMELEDAALVCGASPLKAFWRVGVTMHARVIAGCFLITFTNGLAAFGIPALIGGPGRRFVLSTRIVEIVRGSGPIAQATTLALILFVFSLAIWTIQRFSVRATPARSTGVGARLAPGAYAWAGMFGLGALVLLSTVLPLGALAVESLRRNHAGWEFSSERYIYLFTRLPDTVSALGHSLSATLLAAALTTTLAIGLGYGATRLGSRVSRALLVAGNIAYAVPGTVIALWLIVFFSQPRYHLTDTIWILAIAYFIKYAAFAFQTLHTAFCEQDRRLEEVAWMSGASRLAALKRVVVPLLRPAIVAALFLSIVPMFSELTMSILLIGPGTETLGAMIYRLQDYADPASASAAALVISIVLFVVNLTIRRIYGEKYAI